MKIDAEWLRVYAYDIALLGMPTCDYCYKPVRMGGHVSKLFPWYNIAFHISCHQKHRAKQRREEA